MSGFSIHIPGDFLYAIHDTKLNGFITWHEKKPQPVGDVSGILLFTTGELCEEYISKILPKRINFVSVCKIGKQNMKPFVHNLLKNQIDYALINVPPIVVDQFSEGEKIAEQDLIRDYMIVDLKKLVARFL